MDILLHRISETPNSTLGILYIDQQFVCWVLEDGFRETKIPGVTRIPAGIYPVEPRTEGTFFTKYQKQFGHKFVPWLRNVPGFEFILIHIGNFIKDTRGCLLVGRVPVFKSGTWTVEQSTVTYQAVYNLIAAAFDKKEKETVTIEIVDVLRHE